MEDEQDGVVSTMPHPPAYFKLFGPPARPARGRKRPAAEASGADAAPAAANAPAAADAAAGPQEEKNSGYPLPPPPPPASGETYEVFGATFVNDYLVEDILPLHRLLFLRPGEDGTAASAAGDRLEYRSEMHRLLSSIMANYQQLLDVLVRCPEQQTKKVDDLEHLFVNFHALLNRYRLHQARLELVERLRAQAAEERSQLEELEREIKGAVTKLEEAGKKAAEAPQES